LWEEEADGKDEGDEGETAAEPGAGDIARHLDAALSQVASDAEEAGGDQEREAGEEIDRQVASGGGECGGVGMQRRLAEAEKREGGCGEPEDGPAGLGFATFAARGGCGGGIGGYIAQRAGGVELFVELFGEAIEQPLTAGVFVVIDQGAVVGDPIGEEPDDRDQAGGDEGGEVSGGAGDGLEPREDKKSCDAEDRGVTEGVLTAFFDRKAGDVDRPEDEHEPDVDDAAGVGALVGAEDQERDEAAEEEDDQRRADRHHGIIAERESVSQRHSSGGDRGVWGSAADGRFGRWGGGGVVRAAAWERLAKSRRGRVVEWPAGP